MMGSNSVFLVLFYFKIKAEVQDWQAMQLCNHIFCIYRKCLFIVASYGAHNNFVNHSQFSPWNVVYIIGCKTIEFLLCICISIDDWRALGNFHSKSLNWWHLWWVECQEFSWISRTQPGRCRWSRLRMRSKTSLWTASFRVACWRT